MNILIVLLLFCNACKSDIQAGPDPWNYQSDLTPQNFNERHLPPDLRTPVLKERQSENKAYGEWWFKRLLSIILKSGQIKKSEDGIVDLSVQMRIDGDKWNVLEEYSRSESTLSDDMFRRAVAYVGEAIYKPTITDQIVMAWTDYIQFYLMEYKMYITLLLGVLGVIGTVMWLWKHISHKHVIIIIFVFLYIYEVIISYKEAEQQEYERFVSAVNTCKWYFWTSECTIPPPDPILFMKHMNPLKIGIRMFTSLISEPIIAINSTIKITLQSVTDGLWFPFDKIVYGLLIILINISLIYLLVMIVFNFIFNIPFSLSFLGIVRIGVRQNRRSLFTTNTDQQQTQIPDADRISGERLDRLLNVCSLALTNITQNGNRPRTETPMIGSGSTPKLKRSASTGRLPTAVSTFSENNNYCPAISKNFRKRLNVGSGDGDH